MTKFRCQECGARIAVPPQHMGKLVCCPECGKMTHPLAEQLVGQRSQTSPQPTPPAAPASAERTCDNCGKTIGKLETPQVWEKNIVCAACFAALSPAPVLAPIVVSNPVTELVAVKPVRRSPSAARAGLSFFSRFSGNLISNPVRMILALCALGLAIYFVLSLVQALSLLANLATVGLLLLVLLYFLYRTAPPRSGYVEASQVEANDDAIDVHPTRR